MASKESTLTVPEGWPLCSTKDASLSMLTQSSSELVEKDSFEFDDDSEDEAQPTTVAPTMPSLTPGPCMQACSGSDIQLARGANARPNLTKGRGRFLIVLPGLLSLKPASTKTTKSGDTGLSQSQETTATLSQDIETAASMTQDTETSTKTNVGKTSSAPPLLGRIEQIASDAPVLKIPYPNGKCLVMQGKKVESQTKFMMLTCKSSKESVACKDVFSSVIVFGDPTMEATNSKETMELVQDSDDDDSLLGIMEESPFHHYGGSERTLDGGVSKSTKVRKSVAKAKRVAATTGKPIVTIDDHVEDDTMELDDDVEEVVNTSKAGDDDDIAFVGSDVEVERKKRPRRSTASRIKVDYTQSEESEEASDDDEDTSEQGEDSLDEVAVIEPAKKSVKRPRPSTASRTKVDYTQSGESEEDKATEKGFDNSDADSDEVPVIEPAKNSVKRARRSTASRAKVNYTQSEESDSGDDDVHEDSDDSEVEVIELDEDESEEEFEVQRTKRKPKKKGGKK